MAGSQVSMSQIIVYFLRRTFPTIYADPLVFIRQYAKPLVCLAPSPTQASIYNLRCPLSKKYYSQYGLPNRAFLEGYKGMLSTVFILFSIYFTKNYSPLTSIM
jgi:hypothetical protein